MATSIRQGLHSELAKLLINEIQYSRSNYYYYLGKIEPWDVNDLAPTVTSIDSEAENILIRSNSLYYKKINASDVSLVSTRYNWITGTVYSVWDHTKSMIGVNFYCITDENKVYKCLDNVHGSPSTVKPTSTSYYTFLTGDGYLWKYMYTVPTFKRQKFSSFSYMPVQKSLSDSFYNKGAIEDVVVNNQGSGYIDSLLTTILVTGSTTGSGATGTVVCNANGNITSINLTNGGTLYTKGVSLTVPSTLGINAVLTPVIVGGVVTSITITAPGVGYETGDVINFAVGGAIVIPKVSRITGSIESVVILNGGVGYNSTVTLTVLDSNVIPIHTGKYGNSGAVLSGVVHNGSLVNVTISDPGLYYPADTATTITVQGDGTGAVFTPVVYEGTIIDVIIESAGSNYTSVFLTVVGAGSGGSLTPVITQSDLISDQSIVEQLAVPGAIYSIQVTEGGDNYSSATVVNIVGDGTGAEAVPIIVDGVIIGVTMVSYGSNYTYATITFTDATRLDNPAYVTATGYSILPPYGGHGSDAITELNCSSLCINSSLRQEALLNTLIQDYRQFGIVRNPTDINSGFKINTDSNLVAHTMKLNTVTGLIKDEILTQSDIRFRVVSFDALTDEAILQQLGTNSISISGVLSSTSAIVRNYNIINIISAPVLNKYSGNLLYSSDENPFTFNESQGIIIKTFLSF